MNVFYDGATHSVIIVEGERRTTLEMPETLEATEIIRMITSPAFIPVIKGISR